MQFPELTDRLNRRGRRAGLAVGLSMALTLALCIGAFAWLYAEIEPFVADFVDAEAPIATTADPTGVAAESTRRPTREPTARPAQREPTATPTDTPEAPTSTPDAFRITHLSNPELAVNLRSAPGTDNARVAVLASGTPLQFLGEQQTGPDGFQWMRFRTEGGLEGWLREGTFVPV